VEPALPNDRDIDNDWDEWIAAALFAAPLLVFYNCVWTVGPAIKYSICVVCFCAANFVVAYRRPAVNIPPVLVGWTLVSLLLCVTFITGRNYDTATLVLFLFSIFVLWNGLSLVARIKPHRILACLTIATTLILLQIWFNFDFLTNVALSRDNPVGTLTYDSYPIFGMVAGIAGLLFLHWRTRPAFLPVLGLALVFFILLEGQARGEALAFVVVATLMIAPRGSIFVLPIAAGVLWIGVKYSGLPIFERFRLGLDAQFGDRLQLLADALRLLADDVTFTIGLGINGFQDHLVYEAGWYPHNSALETLISGGVIYFAFYVGLFVVPLIRGFFRFHSQEARILWAIPMFMFLLSLKSYSIFSNWPMMYFVPLSFLALQPTESGSEASEQNVAPSSEQYAS
jgi:hypothetical protein